MREQIKKDIKETVKIIDTSKLEFVNITEYKHLVKDNIWTKAIQTALEEKKNVYIPYMGHEILTDGSIFMDSNTNLKVDEKQEIRLIENSDVYMLRNRNILPGNFAQAKLTNPDENITVTGGIWKSPGNRKMTLEAYCCVTSCFAFSNVKYVNVTNIHFSDIMTYSLMFSNCENIYVDTINFNNCKNDGFHIDGPAKYCIGRNLSGEALGDDMVAILSWDWYNCGMTHGTIEKVFVENVEGDDNEFRLLTGRKVYPDGTSFDCDLKDCVFENISGFYTYKMYYQPHCRKVPLKDENFDRAETVGRMDNIYFNNITFKKVRPNGFSAIPVYGLFDILADCSNLNFENINIEYDFNEVDEMGLRVINAGPISATWKYGESSDDWGDFFDPDRCCTVEDVTLTNIMFNGEKVTDAEKLIKETVQTVNPDYPKTTPEGGTGYGKINKVEVN